MSRDSIAVLTFAVGYNLLGFRAWRHAARFRQPDLSASVRLGLGLSVLRADTYTAEGQAARRRLVWIYAAGLPAILFWMWLWALIA